MKWLLVLLLAGSVASASPGGRKPLLDEQFRGYRDGADGSPRWLAVKGNWRVRDGAFEQLSSEYDCAAIYGDYLDGSFRLDAEFEHLEGDPGVGFIFASRERENTRFAQMARFDGATTFLAGYFQNGEFTGTVSVGTPRIVAHTRHTLSLIVNRENNSFSLLLDGRPLWDTSGRRSGLVYAGGYVGLESSAGRVRFRRVRINATPAPSRPLDWPEHLAVTSDGKFLLPSGRTGTVSLLDRDGTLLRTIGAPATAGGQLRAPAGVCVVGDSLVAVTDRGAHCVHLFSLDGRWKRSAGWKGTAAGQFDTPVAVAALPAGPLLVLEKGNHRVQLLDDTLGTRGEFGAAELVDPLDLAVEGNSIYVVNTGLGRVERYVWNGRAAAWAGSIPYGGGEARGIALRNGRLYLSVVNEVRCYDTTGALLRSLTGRAIDFLLPQGIAASARGISVADYFGGRIVETTPDLIDPAPTFDATMAVTWPSVETGHGVATIDETGEEFSETLFGTSHRVALPAAPARGTTRHLRLAPTLRTIPPRRAPSRAFPLPAAPAPGTKRFARLPMIALIFSDVSDTAPAGGAPPRPALADSEITRIKRQLADAVRFYWIQSGMRLFLDLETLVVHEPLRRSAVYGAEWWYPPNDSLLGAILRINGKRLADYSSVLYLTCTQAYDTAMRSWVLAGKGGAFTNGVGTGKGYGISWWDVTRANHNAGNNWLMVHEFNHQLDDIFMTSGYPEYWFNHISPTIGTAGPFGEHFDANRYILRIVPSDEWYDLRYTALEETGDADGDGIPDNDPRLPLDEARLGSDPQKVDSDSDGVADGDELAFSNWLTEGWGETFGRPIFPNLRSADADSDGVADGGDPLPCSALRTEARRGVPTFLGAVDESRCRASLSCRWSGDTLSVEIAMREPAPVKLMLDLNRDGWFSGSDNILLTASPETPVEPKLQLFDGSSPADWPHMNDVLGRKIGRSSAWSSGRDATTTCRLVLTGLALEHKTIGVLAGLLVPFGGTKRYIDFFEPNRFFPLSLKP